jgi:hypothetical protein
LTFDTYSTSSPASNFTLSGFRRLSTKVERVARRRGAAPDDAGPVDIVPVADITPGAAAVVGPLVALPPVMTVAPGGGVGADMVMVDVMRAGTEAGFTVAAVPEAALVVPAAVVLPAAPVVAPAVPAVLPVPAAVVSEAAAIAFWMSCCSGLGPEAHAASNTAAASIARVGLPVVRIVAPET